MRHSLGTAVVLASLALTNSVNAETIFVTTDGDLNRVRVPFGADRHVTDTLFERDGLFEKLDVFSTYANDRIEFAPKENITQWTLGGKADLLETLRDMPELHFVVCSPVIGGCIGDDVIGDIAGPAPNAEFIHFLHSLHN